eukprot:TRINITY_DN0_c381_g1_i2.p1 TRINITY_DN0_c381_g1~~TRINITY_DN0_c381_g1_i2.p1  ORF type:complete len:128 (+),score=47.63 TRINITY_DN0_c381_g1_i2:63-446(+)
MSSQQSINNIVGIGDKRNVRVHHAPGGKSNFSLGWDDQPETRPARAPAETAPKAPFEEEKVAAPAPTRGKGVPQSQIVFGSEPTDYSRKTGPAPTPAPGPTSVTSAENKTSVRVHNPPGGKSSISFS